MKCFHSLFRTIKHPVGSENATSLEMSHCWACKHIERLAHLNVDCEENPLRYAFCQFSLFVLHFDKVLGHVGHEECISVDG